VPPRAKQPVPGSSYTTETNIAVGTVVTLVTQGMFALALVSALFGCPKI
jgi:hypothetical protein